MAESVFLVLLGFVLLAVSTWGFFNLPRERWQMLAVIPRLKNDDGHWHGTNITYYGFFIAMAYTAAVTLMLILLGAANVPLIETLSVIALLLCICVPAARIIAILVEKKRYTFTISGASFVGILLAPGCIQLVDVLLRRYNAGELPMMPVLAAMAIGYTLGEGLGRLACVSFGCCYGKPVADCSRPVRFLFKKMHFIFTGATKKVAYESRLDGEKLVPVQAMTCLLHSTCVLAAARLYLQGQFGSAFLLSITVSQIWRICSETLRADFRGLTKISAYQKMSGLAVLYSLLLVFLVPERPLIPISIITGLRALWDPAVIVSLQIMWLLIFLYFGRSQVTAATLSFSVVRERI
ncbi:MAG TPA: prolipoprotein diacylglyceryl transferase [Desulfobulbaceae bacterium]|nr:prolipoprotein diacylglyceryl transferase [Desulfobulbaceae bacterium]